MRKILLPLITFSLSCLTSVSAFTQDRQQIASPHREVAIIIQQQSIRFSAPQGTQELRLEIFNHAGELIYDSGVVNGSELSWPLQNAQGEPVASGLYAYSLKIKEANEENARSRGGHLIVDRRQDRDPQTDRLWVTSQSTSGAGATITAADLTVASGKDETVAGARISPKAPNAPPLPKVSGSGTPGQIAKWTDIDIIGDSIISESDSGNVGIGTTTPTQKLQVAGIIHSTTGGVKFPDGTVQTTASLGGVTSVTASGPLASSGGATPNISLAGVVPIANGGTGATMQNFVDLTTGQTIGGTKTFSSNIVGNITGNAGTVTSGVYTTGDQTIGGNKTFANAVNTNSQYNINGSRVLANPGFENLFAGVGAGASNTTGYFNSFFGTRAGTANTEGGRNSFFGYETGRSNTTGSQNSFFGNLAGSSNTEGSNNSFFGNGAGSANNTGASNSFFGAFAGFANASGNGNSFFGFLAGRNNTTAQDNSFFGLAAGNGNTTGADNTFIGSRAGLFNTAGKENTFIGSRAGQSNTIEDMNTFIGAGTNGVAGITNAAAIGWRAVVTASDSLVLGNGSVKVGIGVTNPTEKLQVVGVIHSTTGGIKFPDGSIQTTASVGGGVTSVTASGPLASSGGAAPNITLTGVVPVANGGTGSSTKNFVDLTTGQTIGGTKTFSSNIVGNITGNAGTVTNGVYTTGDQTIGGNKTFANAVNTNSQYNISGDRVLASTGQDNLFAGVAAGASNTGIFNSFFGSRAGSANTEGSFNSFFGRSAGRSNTTGTGNSFFGAHAGAANTDGRFNAFFGNFAGSLNTTGLRNAFFGSDAGHSNMTGGNNSFFGDSAGFSNTEGGSNAFFGSGAGYSNTIGYNNNFFGGGAGSNNNTGFYNSFFGHAAGYSNITGDSNSFFGSEAGRYNTTGRNNVIFGQAAGFNNTTGMGNTIVGTVAGSSNTAENNNTFIGFQADGAVGVTNSTAIGANASVTQSDSLVLGAANVSVGIGVTAPAAKLDVRSGDVYIGTAGKGVILKSPNGSTCRKLTIDDSGALVLIPITCP